MTRTARALAFGLGLGIIFSVVALSGMGAALEEAVSLPWLFRMRGAIEPPSDVIIVAIDKQSADYLRLPPILANGGDVPVDVEIGGQALLTLSQ